MDVLDFLFKHFLAVDLLRVDTLLPKLVLPIGTMIIVGNG
jgi:hypothetical protein